MPRSLHRDLLHLQRHPLYTNQPSISLPRSVNSSIATDTIIAAPYMPSEALRTSYAQSKALMSLSAFDTTYSDQSRFGVQRRRMNPFKSTSEEVRTVTATRPTKEVQDGEKIVDMPVDSRQDIHIDAYGQDFGSAYPKADFHDSTRRKSSNSSFDGEVGDLDDLDSLLQQQAEGSDAGRGMKTLKGTDDPYAQNAGSPYRQRCARTSKVDFHHSLRRQSTNSSFIGEVGDPKGLQSLLQLQSRQGLVERGVNGGNRKRLDQAIVEEGGIKSDARNVGTIVAEQADSANNAELQTSLYGVGLLQRSSNSVG